MRTLHYKTTVFLAAGLMVAMGGVAQAIPSWGATNSNSCRDGCHTNVESGTMDVTGEDGTIDIDALRTDGTSRGTLKFFDVLPGDSVNLSTLVMAAAGGAASDYAVQLKRLEKPGAVGLPAETDVLGWGSAAANTPEWTGQTSGGSPVYFTSSATQDFGTAGYTYVSDTTHTFTLDVDAATPPNWYDLEFAVARNGSRYDDQHFYLHVTDIPEPSSIMLLGLGLFALTYGAWHRRRRAS